MIHVLDASVALKWFVQEEGTARAVAFKDDFLSEKIVLAAPDLMLYEVAGVLKSKKEFTEDSIQDAVGSLLDMGVEIFTPTEESLRRTVRVSFRTGLSFYDSLYVALAEQLGARLLTADREIHKKARPLIATVLVLD